MKGEWLKEDCKHYRPAHCGWRSSCSIREAEYNNGNKSSRLLCRAGCHDPGEPRESKKCSGKWVSKKPPVLLISTVAKLVLWTTVNSYLCTSLAIKVSEIFRHIICVLLTHDSCHGSMVCAMPLVHREGNVLSWRQIQSAQVHLATQQVWTGPYSHWSQPWALDRVYSTWYGLSCEATLTSSQKKVVACITTMPLYHKWAHHAWKDTHTYRHSRSITG